MKTFYYKVIAEGYIEAEDEDEVRDKLEEEIVWNLDSVTIVVRTENDNTKDELGYYGLSQKDFI